MARGSNDRKERLKNRTRRGAKNRGKTGLGKSTVLDYSKANPETLVDGKPANFKFGIEGNNTRIIDILPFVITQEWYKNMKEKSGERIGLEPGDWDYKLEYPTHKTKNGPILCRNLAFGETCPMCNDLYEEWDKDKVDQDESKIKALMISWRCSYNVYNYETGQIELWDNQSYKMFEEVLQEAVDSDDGGLAVFWDLENGLSIEYKTREKSFDGNAYHECTSVEFLDRDEPYDEEVLDKVHPLDQMLNIPTEEEVLAAYHAISNDDKGDEKPKREKSGSDDRQERSARRGSKKTEKEDSKCPNGYEFGVDTNTRDECEKCDEEIYGECSDIFQNSIHGGTKRSGSKSDPEPEPKKEEKENAGRRRRRRNI